MRYVKIKIRILLEYKILYNLNSNVEVSRSRVMMVEMRVESIGARVNEFCYCSPVAELVS